jgi:mannose-6-phosphate isomerase-like protein (cupin superfamily)
MKRRDFIATSIVAGTALNAKALASNDPQKPFVVKAGKARFEDFNPMGILKVSSKDTNGEYCLFEAKNEAGPMAGPPLHLHKYQDEVFMIIEGEYVFQVGNEKIRASSGDTVFGPRTVPHTFYQVSKKGHMIFSYNPAGKMEKIMNEMSKLMPQNPEGFAKVCAENDVPFVGLPMKGE